MAWTERRGRKYRGMYRDVNGRSRTAGWSTSKKQALGLAQDEERKIYRGEWHDPDAGKMLFSTYFEEHWIPNRLGEANTFAAYWSHYRSELKPTFGDMELRKITKPVVQRWVTGLQKAGDLSPVTIHAKYRTLATVLGAREGVSAVFDGLLAKTPCEGIALPKIDRRKVSVYSVTEVDQLMAELGAWWAPIPLLAAETGFRWGELMGLEVRAFAEDWRTVTVHQTVVELTKKQTGNGTAFLAKPRPKSGKPRTVGIGPEVATLVQRLVRERQLFPADRLLSMHDGHGMPLRTVEWPQGRPIHRSTFRIEHWLPAHQRAGVTPRRFHDLRGSHISWLLAGGADIATVMERAGHTNLATTQLYVAAQADANQRALAALAATRKHQRDA